MPSNVGKHGVHCSVCGLRTYRTSGVCRRCDPAAAYTVPTGPPRKLPDVRAWPEDYLEKCARELLRRHEERGAMLAKLGIGRAA